MSYNGSGTFNINSTGQPVVAGTVITASAFNALTTDLATGLTTAITKDGQTTTTARITFAQGITSSLVTDSSSVSTGSIITAGGAGIAKNLYVGGIASFSAQPIFTSLTASSAVATDASKGLVSVTNTGTGNNVLGTAPTIASANLTTALTLTGASGTAGQALTSGGSGVAPTWTTISATPGGSTTQVQYNSSGAFAGSANMTFSGTALTLANDASISGLTVGKGANGVTGNSAFGVGVLTSGSLSGGYNTAIGFNSLAANTSGTNNTGIGNSALNANTTGVDNQAFGTTALFLNTTGSSNTAVGRDTLRSNTTASANTALGYQSMYSNTTGYDCVALGYKALYSHTTGDSCVAIGSASLQNLTNGRNNTAIGYQSGFYTTALTTGAQNILLGAYTRTSSATATYQYVIGYDISGQADSNITIGNQSGKIYNAFTVNATWTQTSDGRLKKNIQDETLGLSFINRLRPVKYEWKASNELELENPLYSEENNRATGITMHGLIAQEVKAALDAEGVDTFAGWDMGADGIQAISREMFISPLIKAIQELKAEFDAYKATHP